MQKTSSWRVHLIWPGILSLALLLVACSAPTDERVGVQVVVSTHGAATEAGLAVLEAGGSAADAAVAVAAALSVVEPWFSSVLGGGTWALYFEAASGAVTSLDGVGPVGSAASVADFTARASRPGMHQAIVPGAWDGWMLWLERYGRLPLGEVLAPAIALARDGYRVSPQMAQWLARDADWILAQPATAAIYAPGGQLLRAGDRVVQRAMADTFEALVAAYDQHLPDGRAAAIQAARDYYYRGPLAQAIVAVSDDAGGYLTLGDFHGFAARIVEPIAIDFGGGVRVFQNPPNSQGITMLLALNVLKGYDLASLGPNDPLAVHLQVEALKLAFADRHAHVGDPDRVAVPVDALLTEAYADQQRARIDPQQALRWPIASGLAHTSSAASAAPSGGAPAAWPLPPDEPTGTTTFHVVDRDGNAAAVTTSLGAQFYVMGDTGIHINNRMRFVALADGDPNQLTPGFKVRHTSNPYLALRHGRPFILGGNTGADVQVQGQLQQFLAVAVFGLSAQEAVARPRFVTAAFPATTFPFAVADALRFEMGVSTQLIEGLEARGHDIMSAPPILGLATMIVLRPTGVEFGADPRSATTDGVVVPRGP